MITGTYSGTFEGAATSRLEDWRRRLAAVTVKLSAFGYKVVVPSEPRQPIEGDPSADAIKLICEREALDVAADALRAANAQKLIGQKTG